MATPAAAGIVVLFLGQSFMFMDTLKEEYARMLLAAKSTVSPH